MTLEEPIAEPYSSDAAEQTAEIVSAYVSNNPVPASEMSKLIADVHRAVSGLTAAAGKQTETTQEPAVNPKRSVSGDHIVCLECGGKFKSLRRHLGANHDMMPEDYRAKWGLVADYPMVAPEYAEQRSKLAKEMGLGRKPGEKAAAKKRK